MKAQEINNFRVGKLQNLSEDDNVGDSFGVPYLSLNRLRLLWEAGFSLLGLDKGAIYWLNYGYGAYPIDENTYNLWKSIIEQIADDCPKLVTAFTVESSVNEFLLNSLYARSICCISAYRKLENVSIEEMQKLNIINTDSLYNTLKDSGRLVIKLQGMFREQDESGHIVESPDEVSFLVISNKNESVEDFSKAMYDLGVKYNQNSILLRNKGVENGYYLGTSDVLNPTTFAPGLGKKAEIGRLLPYKMLDYCSIPFKWTKTKDGYLHTLNRDDAFSFGIEKKKGGKCKRISPNIYKCGSGNTAEYKWVIIKNGVKYGGKVDEYSAAKTLVKLAKEGKLSKHYIMKGLKK